MKKYLLVLVTAVCLYAHGEEPHKNLIERLVKIESGGKSNAIGDIKRVNKAYGPLQIRQTVCNDVNRRYGTKFKATECLGNKELSVKIFTLYMKIWASKERLGHTPTDEDIARIWNGGPNGWKRTTTDGYAAKVRAQSRSRT